MDERLGQLIRDRGEEIWVSLREVGIAYGILALDYAYAQLASDLGSAHTISLAVNL